MLGLFQLSKSLSKAGQGFSESQLSRDRNCRNSRPRSRSDTDPKRASAATQCSRTMAVCEPNIWVCCIALRQRRIYNRVSVIVPKIRSANVLWSQMLFGAAESKLQRGRWQGSIADGIDTPDLKTECKVFHTFLGPRYQQSVSHIQLRVNQFIRIRFSFSFFCK